MNGVAQGDGTMRKILTTLVAVGSIAALAACEQNTKSAQRDAERLEKEADRIEKMGDTAEKKLDERAAAVRDTADAISDGITYEVAKVDKQAGRVHLTRKDLGEPGVNTTEADEKKPEVSLQAGRDLQVTFAELEGWVEGDKKGTEIADELHEGENVRVFMDASGKITKIDY